MQTSIPEETPCHKNFIPEYRRQDIGRRVLYKTSMYMRRTLSYSILSLLLQTPVNADSCHKPPCLYGKRTYLPFVLFQRRFKKKCSMLREKKSKFKRYFNSTLCLCWPFITVDCVCNDRSSPADSQRQINVATRYHDAITTLF